MFSFLLSSLIFIFTAEAQVLAPGCPGGAGINDYGYGGNQISDDGMGGWGGRAGNQEPQTPPQPQPPMDSSDENGVDSQQPPNDWVPDGDAAPDAPCDKPGVEEMTVAILCSLPPYKGTGNDDIFRYYYNPVVQWCLPFSYSGKGGNANRFVSVKNCYEICHPADPSVKKPRVVSGIKAYLVPNLKSSCPKKAKKQKPREVVVRQIPHPLNPYKTLTIIQNARYIPRPQQFHYGDPMATRGGGSGGRKVHHLYQYETQPQYIVGSGAQVPNQQYIQFGRR